MIHSEVKYISDLRELLDSYEADTDYILKSKTPFNYSNFEKLLDIEMQHPKRLNTTFLEFDQVELNGKQLINLSNNLNLNILLKNPTSPQMEEMLVNYGEADMKQCVYPTKIIVLVVLYALYLKHFYKVEVFDEWEELVDKVLEKFIYYTYIQDKYTRQFIMDWSQWYMVYLVENKKEFVQDFIPHCVYLYDTARSYYAKEELKHKYVGEGQRIKSGLYIPLANIMVDMKYNPMKVLAARKNYDYAVSTSRGNVIRTLAPIVEYEISVERYLAKKDKEQIYVEDLQSLTNQDILKLLRECKTVKTKKTVSKVDLFPIEVACA